MQLSDFKCFALTTLMSFAAASPSIAEVGVGAKPLSNAELILDGSREMLDENHEVTDIVIVSNDGDFSRIVSFLRSRGKKVWLGTFGDRASFFLKRIVGIRTTFEIPTKLLVKSP